MSWRDPRTTRDFVYTLLMTVPIGYTVTYGVLAELVGTSPRAIGAYMRVNRDLVVVPCHRVVGSRGLGGFSLGAGFKSRLLRLEGALRDGGLRVIRSVDEYWRILEENGFSIDVDVDP